MVSICLQSFIIQKDNGVLLDENNTLLESCFVDKMSVCLCFYLQTINIK